MLQNSRPDTLGVWLLCALLAAASTAAAQQPQQDPIGRYVTLTSPVDDVVIGAVQRAAMALHSEAVREQRPAFLILEVAPGQSQFHHIYALATFLTSADLGNVTTVAWVPETVTGHNAIIPLVCHEVVMSPEARLGDFGLGTALPPDQQAVVQQIVARQRNRKINFALARAMMDPSVQLLQLTIERDGDRERRLVTAQEAEEIQNSPATVTDSRVLKEPGVPGLFSGEQAARGDFLVRQAIEQRQQILDLYRLPAEALHESKSGDDTPRVSLIVISGAIDSVHAAFVKRQVQSAVEQGSSLIIFEIQSARGQLTEVRDLASHIARLEEWSVKTVAWVPQEATGEAAILALACDEIYLTRESKIGAVARRRQFNFEDLSDSERDFLLATMNELAELKDRPAALLRAMADPKLQVYRATNRKNGSVTFLSDEELAERGPDWQRGPLVAETGSGLLSVDGERAVELQIAQPPVVGFDDLKARLGLPANLEPARIAKTWVDDLIFTLNRPLVTGLLLTIAIICLYLDLHFMTGLLGIVAVVCFALFFWARFLGGTAGTLEIMLFLIGLACLALEIFVVPGTGVFGVSGGVLLVVSLVMASQTFGNIEPGRDLSEMTSTLKVVAATIVAVVMVASLLSRFLPRVPMFSEMILTPPGLTDADFTEAPRLKPEVTASPPVMLESPGVAVTALRPAGKARIDGKLYDVVSNGTYIPADTPIRVQSVQGNHIVVREA